MKVERGKGLFLRSGLGGCFQQPTGMLFCWAFPAFQNAACGVPVWGHLSCAHQTMLMPSKGWGCQHHFIPRAEKRLSGSQAGL